MIPAILKQCRISRPRITSQMTNNPQQQKPVRLGRRSIAALIEVIDHYRTDTEIEHLLFKHGLNERYSGPNKKSRLGNVFHPLAHDNADKSELDNARALCDEVVSDLMDRGIWPDHSEQNQRIYESFRGSLRVDGTDLVEGRIVSFLSPSVEPDREQGVLESRLKQYGFGVASNHLDNALDLASNSKWEPANGEVRSFLESICEAIAAMIYSASGEAPVRGEARKFLTEQGFLNDKESKLLYSLFQVLHGEGGHAGISSSDDCHRRRLMAVSLANYYLERLDYWLASNTPT